MREMIAPQSALDTNPKAKLIPIERILSNPFQVRQDFSSEEAVAALEELAEDLRQRGILQPIIVRTVANRTAEGGGSQFEIVAGERRYRAAGLAGLKELPAIVENFSDEEARLVSLTENLQRRDLNFKEEVEFLARLDVERSEAGKGGESDLAQLIHKSRTYVAKRLKLAQHHDLVEQVANNQLSINLAYAEAAERDRIVVNIGEKNHEVFPGNTLLQEQPGTDPELDDGGVSKTVKRPSRSASRLIPFTRVREAVLRLDQELDKISQDERSQLKEELTQLEEELARFRARL